jgi:integrase
MSKPITIPKPDKPRKPYPEFPLFAHASGRWAKKIRGKHHYFGPWENWQDALSLYQKQAAALHAGRKPREEVDGATIRELVNHFLVAKKHLVETGEIVQRTWDDYDATCRQVMDAFGKERLVADLIPEDFDELRRRLAKSRGIVALGNEVSRVRILFKYAYDADLIEKPVRYGPTFKRPDRKAMRKARQKKGPRMFQPDEIRALLGEAGVHLRAMVLLGINCGFGPSDCGNLPLNALDLKSGWVNFPRPKTGVTRRCALWPETIDALKKSIAKRPKPKDEADNGIVFLTKYRDRWAKESSDNPISKEFAKILKPLKVKRGRKQEAVYRKGMGLYTLRHTFQTIGDGARDPIATRDIMGHAEVADDMSAVYREGVDDARLKAVTDHVRQWLFPADETKPRAVQTENKTKRKRARKSRAVKPPVASAESHP